VLADYLKKDKFGESGQHRLITGQSLLGLIEGRSNERRQERLGRL
jgi:hypothetical protein